MSPQIFLWISVAFTALIYGPYLKALLARKVRPHIFSWVLWGLSNIVVAAAQIDEGGGIGTYTTILSGILCFIVVIISFRQGEKDITRMDWVIFLFVLAAIPLWIATKNPLTAVILMTGIDVFSAFPTVRKSYHKPFEESVWLFFFSGARFVASLPSLAEFNLTTVLFPLVIGIGNLMIAGLIVWRRKILKNPASSPILP